jgi:hypothetical protein
LINIGTKDNYWVFKRLLAVLVGVTVVAGILFVFQLGDKSLDNKKYILWSDDVWLVIIGVGDYPYAGYISKFGEEDAMSLTYEFSKFVSNTRINLITDEDATKSGIQNAFENWLVPRESADSTVVVYMAGHGTPMYFAPFDSVAYTDENNISSQELGYWLDMLDSQNVVLLMDFCNSFDYSLYLNKDNIDIMTCGSLGQICWESEVESPYVV